MTMRFTKNWKKSRLREVLRAVGDLLLPRVCLTCGRRLGVHENHLCLACEADLPLTYHWLHAHNPLADRFNAVLERHRGTEPMDYAYAVALLHYKGPYRQIPRALKYHGNLAAGRHFGSMLGRRIAAAPHLADIDLIIPVPLHWTRRRARGYNQAEILARAIAATLTASRLSASCPIASQPAPDSVNASPGPAYLPDTPSTAAPLITTTVLPDAPFCAHTNAPSRAIPVPPANSPPAECRTDLLVRTRRTRTQTRLSVDQKAQNVASAFRVPSGWWHSLFTGRSIIANRYGKRHSSTEKTDNSRIGPPGDYHTEPSGDFQTGPSSDFQTGRSGDSQPVTVRNAQSAATRHSRLDRESPARKALASARHILLVDDTYTTGATLYACYAALRPYTSARISIATLAAVEGTPSAGP